MPENNPRFGAPGTTEPKLLDVLASEARTALDDPAGVGLTSFDLHPSNAYGRAVRAAHLYAIDRLDDIISLLNPSEETREAYARTLKLLGMHIAERQDVIEASELSYEEHDEETRRAYAEAHEHLTLALDHLDTAIGALAPGQS